MPPIAQKGNPLKVASFNINNINKRLDNLLAWLAKAEPDVVQSPRAQGRAGSISRERPSDSRVTKQSGKGSALRARLSKCRLVLESWAKLRGISLCFVAEHRPEIINWNGCKVGKCFRINSASHVGA
jgi:hypothetical protein